MTVRVLVIGRGSSAEQFMGQHRLVFQRTSYENDDHATSQFTELDDYDFVLLHVNNQEAPAAFEAWSGMGYKERIIGITGGSIDEPWISAEIATIEFLGTRNEVLQLKWNAVPDAFQGSARAFVALLKSSAPDVGCLTVLAILCQGYLAVNAKSENDKWGPPEIQPALEQMGWPETMEDEAVRELLRDDLPDQRNVVAKSDWWLDVFEPADDVAVQVKTLQEQLREEWNEGRDMHLPDEVTQLLEALTHGTLEVPSIVANAYCKIAEKLGGSPCPS